MSGMGVGAGASGPGAGFAAATRRQALQAVDALFEAAGVRRVVNGRSRVSEEPGLLEHLNEQEVEVPETDRGQFVVQLSPPGPIHLTAPVIHEDTTSVARLFRDVVGFDVPAHPEVRSVDAVLALGAYTHSGWGRVNVERAVTLDMEPTVILGAVLDSNTVNLVYSCAPRH